MDVSPYKTDTDAWTLPPEMTAKDFHWWRLRYVDGRLMYEITDGEKVIGSGRTTQEALKGAGLWPQEPSKG